MNADESLALRTELRVIAEERVGILDGPISERSKAIRARAEWRAATELARLAAERDRLLAGMHALRNVLSAVEGEVARTTCAIINIMVAPTPGPAPESIAAQAQAMIDAAGKTRQ